MKNLTFNFKSIVQTKARWLLTFCALLTLSVGQIWAVDVKKPKVYFNNGITGWSTSNLFFAVGKDGYTRLYYMSTVSNTQLMFVDVGNYSCTYCGCDCQQWGDANYVAFAQNSTAWDQSGSYGYDHLSGASGMEKYTGKKSNYGMNAGNYYYCYTDAKANGSTLNVDFKSSGNSGIPTFTATLAVETRNGTSASYDAINASAPATLTLQGTILSGDGTSSRTTGTAASVTWPTTTTRTAVVTGEVTVSYSSLGGDWQFDGWYIGGVQKSTSTSYTYNQSANTTVTARFSKIKFAVTLDNQSSDAGQSPAATTNVTATYGSAMPSITTLPTKENYTLQGFWGSEAGGGNQYYNGSGASQRNWDVADDATIYAKWTQSVTLKANTANHGSGDDKTATAVWNKSSLESFTATGAADGYHVTGYYTGATDGVKVLNADGSFADTDIDGYITSGKWSRTATTTLYAHLTTHEWALYRNSGANKVADFVSRGSDVYTLNLNIVENTNNDNWSLKLDGTTMYEFPSSSPVGTELSLTTGSTYRNWNGGGYGYYTIQIRNSSGWKCQAWVSPQITFTANPTGGSVTAEASVEGSISSGAKITYNTNVTFTAGSAETGYTFDGWYENSDFSDSKISSSSSLAVNSITANTARYAHYTEDLVTLTANDGAHGSASASVASIGVATSSTITVTPETNWHVSSWDLSSNVVEVSSTTNQITVRTNGTGSEATVTPIYAEDDSDYKLYKQTSAGVAGTDELWATFGAATKTVTITSLPANTTYKVFVYDGSKYYRNSSGKINPNHKSDDIYQYDSNNNTHYIEFKTGAAGDYTFAFVYPIEGNRGSLSATYPVEAGYSVTVQKNAGAPDGAAVSCSSATLHQYEYTEMKATVPAGYRFDGWSVDGSHSSYVTFDDASSTTVKVTAVEGAADAVITATITNTNRIYVDRSAVNGKWASGQIYITLYGTGGYWNDDDKKGTGARNTEGYTNTKGMTRIPDTDIYYYDFGETNITGYFCFTDQFAPNAEWFYKMAAVYRSDFNPSSGNNMFVIENYVQKTKNETGYYYGYWTKYNETTPGIKLHVYSPGSSTDISGSPYTFTTYSAGLREYSVKVHLSSTNTYPFELKGDNGEIYYKNNGNMTTTNCGPWPFTERTGSKGSLTTTAEGDYKFTLNCADKLYVTVEYPLNVNDYRVVFSGKVSSSGSSKDHPSQVVRHIGAVGTKQDTLSFFVVKDDSWELQLQKCTAVSPETWNNVGAPVAASTFGNPATGVYNFIVKQDSASGTAVTPAFVEFASGEFAEAYSGNYYIRTDASKGGWEAYRSATDNLMTYSDYAKQHSGYDYYKCSFWGYNTNVKFCIANDFSACVSDTFYTDTYATAGEGKLPADASVRFMWNSTTNALSRAYLNGSYSGGANPYLYLQVENGTAPTIYNTSGSTFDGNIATFGDKGNWVYQLDLKADQTARVKLISNYSYNSANHLQYFKGKLGDWSTANTEEILGGEYDDDDDPYNLRIVYDYKTNHLVSAWLADGEEVDEPVAIHTDVMIVREAQEDAKQITFSEGGKLTDVDTVYAVMKFNKWTLNNKAKGDGHATLTGEDELSRYERDLYWISFPFDVRLNDVFGFGTYGTHWIIEYYDGKGRAKNGFWADSPSNWKFVTPAMRDSYILKANEGYILALDLDQLGESSSVWNYVEDVYLYFPSKDKVGNIKKTDVKVDIDQVGYKCIINRGTTEGDRRIKDSYWHCIGIPSFADVTHDVNQGWTTGQGESSSSVDAGDYPSRVDWTTKNLPYLYEWEPEDNTLTPIATEDYEFKAMWSYLVQYNNDTIWWKQIPAPSASVIARVLETPDENFKLSLYRNEKEEDHTFVKLTDNANVTTAFEFNHDLSKEMNKNRGNIWTVTADTVEVAGNSMPKPVQTTVVPVGVKVVANGEYTLAMPEGTNGENVYLIDNAYGTRTNLGLMPYTVTLTAGTYDSRFALEFAPIQDSPTSLENDANANANANADVRKVFVGGRLYIIRDGKVYDAAGQRVE